MNTEIIDKEIEFLYKQSLENPQIILSYFVNNDENLIVRVDTYTSLNGNGFNVIGILKENEKRYMRVKNYGPFINSEMGWKEIILQPSLSGQVLPYTK